MTAFVLLAGLFQQMVYQVPLHQAQQVYDAFLKRPPQCSSYFYYDLSAGVAVVKGDCLPQIDQAIRKVLNEHRH